MFRGVTEESSGRGRSKTGMASGLTYSGMQAAYTRKQGINDLNSSKKVDLEKKNPFLSRIFLVTEQVVSKVFKIILHNSLIPCLIQQN